MKTIVTKKEISTNSTNYSGNVLGIIFIRTSDNRILARRKGMDKDYIGDAENKQEFVNAIYQYINTYLPNHTTHFKA